MSKAYAKVNIFLKIVGINGNYHNLVSRFILVEELYDEISFQEKTKENKTFEIDGDFNCPTESNTIYKAYLLIKEYSKEVETFFKTHKVVVEKNIPSFAGLGGGSSDAATFLKMTIKQFDLKIPKDKLLALGKKIGADVPFFLSGYKSANVSGIGEVVVEFKEELPKLSIITPDIECSTKDVFMQFRKNLKNEDLEKNTTLANRLVHKKSVDILKEYNSKELNDLLLPSIQLKNTLQKYVDKNLYFSGSGSSFFEELHT